MKQRPATFLFGLAVVITLLVLGIIGIVLLTMQAGNLLSGPVRAFLDQPAPAMTVGQLALVVFVVGILWGFRR